MRMNKDGKVSPEEYQALQDYNQKDKNRAGALETQSLAEVLQTKKR